MVEKRYEEYLIMKRSVEELISEHEKLRLEVADIKQALESAREGLKEKNEEVKELKTRYERVKFSGAILGNSEDAETAKRRVNELVREIDKCIALLDR